MTSVVPSMASLAASSTDPNGLGQHPSGGLGRQRYVTTLGYLFAFFSTVRVFAYLPTLWAVVYSGDSSQHSLLTWFTWAGANLTMAAWLYEQQGQRWNRAVTVNLVNATMCIATFVAIWALRM